MTCSKSSMREKGETLWPANQRAEFMARNTSTIWALHSAALQRHSPESTARFGFTNYPDVPLPLVCRVSGLRRVSRRCVAIY